MHTHAHTHIHNTLYTAQLIIQPPLNTTAALGTNATFSCRGNDNITWEISNTQIRDPNQVRKHAQYGIYAPLPKPNISELIITATNVTNFTISIICLVGSSNSLTSEIIRSEEVKLLAYGEYIAVS